MSILLPLLFAVLIVATAAALVKLAAVLLRRTRVTWMHALAFGGILLVLTLVGRLAEPLWIPSVPQPIPALVGIALNLAIGTWFFSTRATTAEGQVIGRRGALKLTALMLVLMLAIGVLGGFVSGLLSSPQSS